MLITDVNLNKFFHENPVFQLEKALSRHLTPSLSKLSSSRENVRKKVMELLVCLIRIIILTLMNLKMNHSDHDLYGISGAHQ